MTIIKSAYEFAAVAMVVAIMALGMSGNAHAETAGSLLGGKNAVVCKAMAAQSDKMAKLHTESEARANIEKAKAADMDPVLIMAMSVAADVVYSDMPKDERAERIREKCLAKI